MDISGEIRVQGVVPTDEGEDVGGRVVRATSRRVRGDAEMVRCETDAVIREQIARVLGGTDAGEVEVPGSEGSLVARRSLVFESGDPSALPETMPTTFRKKGVVQVGGASLLAELAVVRLFTQAGWEAGWWNPFGGAGWVVDGDLSLKRQKRAPSGVGSLLDELDARRGSRSGRWDVAACQAGLIAFAECKRRGSDRLKSTQGQWLRACLDFGVPHEAFVIVEWGLASQSTRASHTYGDGIRHPLSARCRIAPTRRIAFAAASLVLWVNADSRPVPAAPCP